RDDAPSGTIPVLGNRMAVITDNPNITPADRAHRPQEVLHATGTGVVTSYLHPGRAIPPQEQGLLVAPCSVEFAYGPDVVRPDGVHAPQVIVSGTGVRAGDYTPRRAVPVQDDPDGSPATASPSDGPNIVAGNCNDAI